MSSGISSEVCCWVLDFLIDMWTLSARLASTSSVTSDCDCVSSLSMTGDTCVMIRASVAGSAVFIFFLSCAMASPQSTLSCSLCACGEYRSVLVGRAILLFVFEEVTVELLVELQDSVDVLRRYFFVVFEWVRQPLEFSFHLLVGLIVVGLALYALFLS